MNTFILVLLIIVFFPIRAHTSNWILILSDSVREAYVDTDSIKIKNKKRKALVKTIRFNAVNLHPKSDLYWSKYFINEYQFDCEFKKYRILSGSYFDINDVKLPKINIDKSWLKINEGTKTEKFYNVICTY